MPKATTKKLSSWLMVPYRFMLNYKPTKLEQKHKPETISDSAAHKMLHTDYSIAFHNTYTKGGTRNLKMQHTGKD